MIVSFSRWPHMSVPDPKRTSCGRLKRMKEWAADLYSAQTGEVGMTRQRFTIIEAPSVLGLFPEGRRDDAGCFAHRGSWRAIGSTARWAR